METIKSADYARRANIAAMVSEVGPIYSSRFHGWLITNWPMWESFRAAADKVRDRGFRDYSAYVIVNVLRWRADVRGEKFSMTNTMIPDLARLYNALYGPLFKTSTRFGKEAT